LVADKRQLRAQMRNRRRQLSQDEQQSAADGLLRQLSRLSYFRNVHRVAFYFPNDGEIDPRPTIEHAWRIGKQCFLPVVNHPTSPLRFARHLRQQPTRPNRFGIPEPVVRQRDLLKAHNLQLILVPLIAFDATGGRLGMGAGFYDRTLAFLRGRKYWHSPMIIGAAHSFQQVEHVPQDSWDVCLRGIVTEKAFLAV
jgi:5-formyltetrahydrofolate cyclo-ligase